MRKSKKRILIWIVVNMVILAGLVFGWRLYRVLQIGVAYKAKVLCSSVFVSQRSAAAILQQDLSADDLSILSNIDAEVDYQLRLVESSFWSLIHRTAIFRPGLGCALVINSRDLRPEVLASPHAIQPRESPEAPWPEGEGESRSAIPTGVDLAALGDAIENAFSESNPDLLRRTRAIVVVFQGHILGERYAPGFSKDTPLLGWSMTKTVFNVLLGILVREGRLAVDSDSLVAEWSKANDPRRNIRLDHLLRMTSGLEFEEDYSDPLADATRMLLGTGNVVEYAVQKPLTYEPGKRFSYSSGTTNILSGLIRERLNNSGSDYESFPQRELFSHLGMKSAILEMDASGNFVASSFMYATARDWARLGLFLLHDGVWQGRRLLPEGWLAYSLRPTTQDPKQEFGAHLWRKLPWQYRNQRNRPDSLPADSFHAIGHEGQLVTVIPSRELVVVRLGLSRLPGSWNHEQFVQLVLNALAPGSTPTTISEPAN